MNYRKIDYELIESILMNEGKLSDFAVANLYWEKTGKTISRQAVNQFRTRRRKKQDLSIGK